MFHGVTSKAQDDRFLRAKDDMIAAYRRNPHAVYGVGANRRTLRQMLADQVNALHACTPAQSRELENVLKYG